MLFSHFSELGRIESNGSAAIGHFFSNILSFKKQKFRKSFIDLRFSLQKRQLKQIFRRIEIRVSLTQRPLRQSTNPAVYMSKYSCNVVPSNRYLKFRLKFSCLRLHLAKQIKPQQAHIFTKRWSVGTLFRAKVL